MISKACIVGQYQTKLQALASHPDIELTVVVPPFWKDERGITPLERAHTEGYTLLVAPIALQGHFHTHYYPTLPRILGRVLPDIVHIDEEPYNLATFLGVWACRHTSTRPLFFTWQNLSRRYPLPFSWFEAYTYKHSACAIAGTAEAAHVLSDKGFRRPVHIIPQFGVDPHTFVRARPISPPRPFTIGFAARFVEEKGAQVLISAVAGLGGVWQLRLLGSGPLQKRLQAQVTELGLQDRVFFDAPRASLDMPAFFNQLDVFVLPSLTRPNWKEQFGRVLVEAMSCGIPVVGSNSGEIPNIVGDAGLIFPEGAVPALTSVLDRLMHNRALAEELGERGRARVLEHYTQDIVAAETYAVYRQLLSGRPAQETG